jgi:hypothetical protein
MDDFKRQSKIIRKHIEQSSKRKKIRKITNKIRDRQFEFTAGIKIHTAIAYQIWCLIEMLKKSPRSKDIKFLISYLTLFVSRRFGVVWNAADNSKEIAFGISILSGTLASLILA